MCICSVGFGLWGFIEALRRLYGCVCFLFYGGGEALWCLYLSHLQVGSFP